MNSGQSTDSSIHVCIVHYNTPALTAKLATSLPGRSRCKRRVFIHILDNNSTSHNLELLRQLTAECSNVTLQVSDSNLGFGGGMNRIASDSTINQDDLIWLLNSDTSLDEGCLELLEASLDNDEFDIVSPLIYSGEVPNLWIWYCGGSIEMSKVRAPHHLYGRPTSDAPAEPFDTEFITGAAPMMRARTFLQIGGFPANYFLYWEDALFSWRARSAGMRLGVIPMAKLWHQVGASSGIGQTRTYYYWAARNRFLFGRDIGVPTHRLLLGRGGIESLRPIARALLVERKSRLSKAAAAVRGTTAGLRDVSGFSKRTNAVEDSSSDKSVSNNLHD